MVLHRARDVGHQGPTQELSGRRPGSTTGANMLIDEIVEGILEAAADPPEGRRVGLNHAFQRAWDVGYLPAGVAAGVDAACVSRPLAISAIARAAVLNRPEWFEEDIDDRMPLAWETVAVHLAASMGGAGPQGLAALNATADMGDGGRIALAGLLNPVMRTPLITEVEWHPSLTYPPVAAIAMLNENCTLAQLTRLAEIFTSGREDPGWVLAPFLGASQTVSWPEWEAVLEWIGAEEPTGTPAWWIWLLRAIDAGQFRDAIGADDAWHDVPGWETLVHERLGWLLDHATDLTAHQTAVLPELRECVTQSRWPAVKSMQ